MAIAAAVATSAPPRITCHTATDSDLARHAARDSYLRASLAVGERRGRVQYPQGTLGVLVGCLLCECVEDGQWQVVDKPLAPASVTAYQATPGDGVDRTVMLQNPAAASGQVAVLRGPGAPDPVAPEPQGRVIRLSSRDIEDVFDILSLGSRVTIQR